MTPQFEEAMRIFTDIYGYPKWEKEAKDGQSRDAIVSLWDRELREYTVQDVKEACYRLIRYRKTMTFPTISHLMSELIDKQKEMSKDDEIHMVLKALLNAKPPCSELATQRTMWAIYQYKYNGYDPEKDQEEK